VAAIIAVAVNTEGKREIVGLGLGPSEAETFWSAFLKGLLKRGLRGIKLVISDAPEGLKHAINKMPGAPWQRCRVHGMRSALAHVPIERSALDPLPQARPAAAGRGGQHTMVAAALRQAFLQPDQEAARQAWRQLADQLRPRWPKLSGLMDASEHDILAYMAFPVQHRAKLPSTNPLERLNKEVKRRADVVGIFPGEASVAPPTRLPGGRWLVTPARTRLRWGVARQRRPRDAEHASPWS
jgi:transposase-like protein